MCILLYRMCAVVYVYTDGCVVGYVCSWVCVHLWVRVVRELRRASLCSPPQQSKQCTKETYTYESKDASCGHWAIAV